MEDSNDPHTSFPLISNFNFDITEVPGPIPQETCGPWIMKAPGIMSGLEGQGIGADRADIRPSYGELIRF